MSLDSSPESRCDVLVHAPFGKDAEVIGRVLARSEISVRLCRTRDELYEGIRQIPGMVLIADEALNKQAVREFSEELLAQPPWSDLPVVVMTSGGAADEISLYRLKLLAPLGNVTLLERPCRKVTLVSAVSTSLRARARQFEIRDYIAANIRAQDALRASEQRWRFLANALPNFVWVTNASGQMQFLNDYWYEYTGFPPGDLDSWMQAVYPDDVQLVTSSQGTEPDGRSVFEYRVKRASDGAWRWHLGISKSEPAGAGEQPRRIGAGIDIHDLREAEAALRRSNHALEQFAYAAAHDLQEPARTVSLYTEMLAKKLDRGIDDETAQYISFATQSARRMQTLIQDLLRYTHAVESDSTQDLRADVETVTKIVADNLQAAIADAKAEIVVSKPAPVVTMAQSHLIQIIQNLVSNALKYRSHNPPCIRISVETRDEDWLFAVQDNGQGIAPEHYMRVFELFKRLHGREVPGTGIGLAICHRLVTHYGGQIWLESEAGQGTTFYFSIPQKGATSGHKSRSDRR